MRHACPYPYDTLGPLGSNAGLVPNAVVTFGLVVVALAEYLSQETFC